MESKSLKIKSIQNIAVADWDDLVKKTYNRPYNFQQQDGCKSRGTENIQVPNEFAYDFEDQTVPEVVNHSEMGVAFDAWLDRDPQLELPDKSKSSLKLWWHRNFYPSVDMVANDLHTKGLLHAGEYQINIDW